MFSIKKLMGALALAAMALSSAVALPGTASAQSIIAHRGLFHDVNENYNIPENTFWSIVRAYDMGVRAVEIDLRKTRDGEVVVTHDMISNRTTHIDGDWGYTNPVDVALGQQRGRDPIAISSLQSSQLRDTTLKAYARNGKLLRDPSPRSNLASMYAVLEAIKKGRPDIIRNNDFFIVLDIQDPYIFHTAAKLVKHLNLDNDVHLKFFASKALDTTGIDWNGPASCREYSRRHGLQYLNLIPQINDGELEHSENVDGGIRAFGRVLTVEQYLDCWINADKWWTDSSSIWIVSASVPANNIWATNIARRAISSAKWHGRQTMTIVPNPDAARVQSNGQCWLYSFNSTKVGANHFNADARRAKFNFAAEMKPDLIIYDIMGDARTRNWHVDYNRYTTGLC